MIEYTCVLWLTAETAMRECIFIFYKSLEEKGMKKFIAEFIGTCVLVTLGCGTAMLTGCEQWGGYIATALAFGLVIVGMAYCVGNVSGCHINPAVSLAVLINGGITVKEFCLYVCAQVLGAFAGAGLLAAIFGLGGVADLTGGLGSNGLGGVNGSIFAGLLVEVVLTFIFVLTILGVTSKKANHGSFGGLIIGLTLVLVHLLGIGLTGTSVNPARSIGPAIVAAIQGNMDPIGCVWVFIVGPFIGAIIAAFVYKLMESSDEKTA